MLNKRTLLKIISREVSRLFVKTQSSKLQLKQILQKIPLHFAQILRTAFFKKPLNNCFSLSEGYSEPCQSPKIQLFAKIINGFKSLTISAKRFVLDFLKGAEYVFVYPITCYRQGIFLYIVTDIIM